MVTDNCVAMAVGEFYRVAMSTFVCRLLALFAVLLMPFGMSAVPAAAAQHEQMGAMAMQHCPDQNSKQPSKGALADCTMACAAALPAAELPQPATPLAFRVPVEPNVIPSLSGIELEIATPPPRLS
jgi:hypothetical protein